MNIIITMAGAGARFREAGYHGPKHEIVSKGKTLFAWSLTSLQNFSQDHFIFIGQKKDNLETFIPRTIPSWVRSYEILTIDYHTKGQAETAVLAKERLADTTAPAMVFNIDTYIEPDALCPKQIRGDGWVPVFRAEGDKWSFARFDEDLRVYEVTEKIRISEFGTIGLYYFSSFGLFEEAYQKYSWGGYKEQYIAPLYHYLIDTLKKPVYTSLVPSGKVHVLGTPEDLRIFDPDITFL